jgi:hypothetical protein
VGLADALVSAVDVGDPSPSVHLDTVAAREAGVKSAQGP